MLRQDALNVSPPFPECVYLTLLACVISAHLILSLSKPDPHHFPKGLDKVCGDNCTSSFFSLLTHLQKHVKSRQQQQEGESARPADWNALWMLLGTTNSHQDGQWSRMMRSVVQKIWRAQC